MIHAPVLAAGVFGSIGMLAWASVALIPLLLHMWNRRKHREAPWAAMEFLLAAIQEQSRRMRIEQLLLLLLRIAIPCVLALALADPLWQLLPTQGNSLGSRPARHHLFLIDTSYSMGYEVDGQSRLEQAKQIVREIIEKSPQGDGFTLLRMSDPSTAVVGSPAYAKNDILIELNALENRDYVANLATGFALAKQMLQQTRNTHPRLTKHRMYVLSDMGRSTWGNVAEPSVRKTLGELESLAELVTVDVGVQQSNNAAIVSAERIATIPMQGSTISWNVAARSWSTGGVSSQEIEMRVDDRLASKKTVELRSGQPTTASFSYQFDSSGSHVVSFHLSGDALAADNQRFEIVTVRKAINILCVEGRPRSARNVAIALSPSKESRVQIQTVRDHRFGNMDLQSFDAIFLCNIGSVTSQQASQLRDFLGQGRGVIMFLGDQTRPQNHNDQLGSSENNASRILPTDLLTTTPYGLYPLAPADYVHPLIEPFRGQEQSGLLSTPIWSYMRIKRPKSGTASVALEFSNGDPAIIEHSVLGGRFAVVATAPSQESVLRNEGHSTPWNAWSVWPSFPPVVQELLTYAVGGLDDAKNVRIGQSIGGSIPIESSSDHVTVRDTKQYEQRVAIKDDASLPTWTWAETHNNGVYTANLSDEETVSPYAVNLANYRDSEPNRMTVSELPSQFQTLSIAASDLDSSNTSIDSTFESSPLFRQMLGLLLVLLLAETTVAWYFGNARA